MTRAAPPPVEPHSPAAVRAERDLRLLDELADMGMQAARTEFRESERLAGAGYVAPQSGPGSDHRMRFAQIARLVAQIVALKQKVVANAARPCVPGEDLRRAAARRAVHQALNDDLATLPRRGRLRVEIDDRLDQLDIDGAFRTCGSFEAVVENICRRLGIKPPGLDGDLDGDLDAGSEAGSEAEAEAGAQAAPAAPRPAAPPDDAPAEPQDLRPAAYWEARQRAIDAMRARRAGRGPPPEPGRSGPGPP